MSLHASPQVIPHRSDDSGAVEGARRPTIAQTCASAALSVRIVRRRSKRLSVGSPASRPRR